MDLGAAKLFRGLASGRILSHASKYGVHLIPVGDQARHAPAAYESARPAHQHDFVRHQTAAASNAYSASRSETTAGAIGHRIPSAGSFHRSPLANPAAYGTE